MLLDEHNFPAKGQGRVMAVANEYGITQGSAQKWMSASTLPEIDKLVGIAQLFGVSVDDLLGLDTIKESISGGTGGLLNRYILMQKIDELQPIQSLNTDEVMALPVLMLGAFKESNPADLVAYSQISASMSPTFMPGSTLIANRSAQFIQQALGKISSKYEPACIVRNDENYAARRIIVRAEKKLFSCDHPSYERESFDQKMIVAIVVGSLMSV